MREEDAKLMAVAPELLKVMKEYVRGGVRIGAPTWEVELFNRAKSAIANAEKDV